MKQSDYTLSDVIRLKPSWLKDSQDDLPKFNEILDSLASMMDFGFNYIASYPFLSVFKTKDISSMPMSEINKAIHEYREEATAKQVEVKHLASNHRSIVLRNAINDGDMMYDTNSLLTHIDTNNSNIARRERDIDGNHDDIRNCLDKIRSYNDYISEYYDKIKELEGSNARIEAKIASSVGNICKDKLALLKTIPDSYELLSVTKEGFTVARKDTVICKFTNAMAGVNKEMDLGYFSFTFNFDDLYCTSRVGIANNIKSSGYAIHPHVGSYICWGNMGTRAKKAQVEKDIPTLFKLLDLVLETYCPDNPFRRWGSYVANKHKHKIHLNLGYMKSYPSFYAHIYRNTPDAEWKATYETYFKQRAKGTLKRGTYAKDRYGDYRKTTVKTYTINKYKVGA